MYHHLARILLVTRGTIHPSGGISPLCRFVVTSKFGSTGVIKIQLQGRYRWVVHSSEGYCPMAEVRSGPIRYLWSLAQPENGRRPLCLQWVDDRTTPYGLTFDYEKPKQAFFLIDKKRGRTGFFQSHSTSNPLGGF